jgi:hypothetical protein
VAGKVQRRQAKGKRSTRVERARRPEDVQRLAYGAAVAELQRRGIGWTDADTNRLRQALGLERSALQTDARRVFTKLAQAMHEARPALQAACDFASEHGPATDCTPGVLRVLCALADVDGAARRALALAGEPASCAFVERETLRDYAEQEIGWWSGEALTARTLALLSVLAGIPTWEGLGGRPTGAEGLAAERRAMAHHLKDHRR